MTRKVQSTDDLVSFASRRLRMTARRDAACPAAPRQPAEWSSRKAAMARKVQSTDDRCPLPLGGSEIPLPIRRVSGLN